MPKGEWTRRTRETEVRVLWGLGASRAARIQTGLAMLDHLLEAFAFHGFFDIQITAKAEMDPGGHHMAEDVGVCMGKALRTAIGDAGGLARFGHSVIPMDETLAYAAVDISGRAHLEYGVSLPAEAVGGLEAEAIEEFFKALTREAAITLHVGCHKGSNSHHMAEAMFKAVARALAQATAPEPRVLEGTVLSTKGSLLG